jgi:hypothetical protein
MLHTYCPTAILQQHDSGAFLPGLEASAAHCCFSTEHVGASGHILPEASSDRHSGEEIRVRVLRVPEEYPTMQAAVRAGAEGSASVIQVAGGSDLSWSGTIFTAGGPELAPHPDLQMADLADGAPARRFAADRLPCLQPQINHALEHPRQIPAFEAAEIAKAHAARYSESHLVADRHMAFEGMVSVGRPDPDDAAPLVPYPNSLVMPRQRVRVDVRGPPNARTWGRWRLDRNCFGAFEGLTCSWVRGREWTHVEYSTFTIICLGGPWELLHVDVRAGGVS